MRITYITLLAVAGMVFSLGYALNYDQAIANDMDNDWWQSAQAYIDQLEYNINWQDDARAYQSPNRAQDLRFTYYPNGFAVQPRSNYPDSIPWCITFRINSWGYPGQETNFQSTRIQVKDNTARVVTKGLTIEYVNSEEGMRQNFVVESQSPSLGKLYINFIIEQHGVTMHGKEQLLAFVRKCAGGATVMHYGDLCVWDARGYELPAELVQVTKNTFTLTVNTKHAEFPITIDPLSTNPDWEAEGNQTNAAFGSSLASVGDVNGDGYGDIAVSAPNFDVGGVDQGRVFVYSGSASGPSVSPDWMADGEAEYDHFGQCISSGLDINNDGYSDIVVGAPNYSSNQGKAYVYYGSSSGLSTNPDWTGTGENGNDYFGYYVSCAGDVNGDGYSDIIITAPYYPGGGCQGKSYVYHGSSSGISGSPFWTATGENNDDFFGVRCAYAGDVNSDAYSDIIINAPGYPSGNNQGKAYVYHGSSSGLSGTPHWTTIGENNNDQYSIAISAIGDVNGDGYSDVGVGAPAYPNAAYQGKGYVYHGSSSGLSTTPAWTGTGENSSDQYGFAFTAAGDVNGDGYADAGIGASSYPSGGNQGKVYIYYGAAAGLSTDPVWSALGENNGDQFGFCVSDAGDVNDDGFSDLLISAITYDNGHTDEGKVYLYFGGSHGLSMTDNWHYEGNQGWAYYGRSVSSAGDVNGDGYSDVIVGATHYDNGQNEEGMTFVYHGSQSGLSATPDWTAEGNQVNAFFGSAVASAGDVNGDGYSDVVIGAYYASTGQTGEGKVYVYQGSSSGLSSTPDWQYESNSTNAYLGMSANTAGDVNGDGYSDIIVSAPNYGDASYYGRVYVFHGSLSGLSSTPDWSLSGGIRDKFGSGVCTAGDVNGDGYSDVIIGSDHWDYDQAWEGAAFVYHGSSTGLSTTPAWSAEGNQINAYYGNCVSTAGDVNGDGYSDVIVGDSKYDVSVTDEGRAYVYHGSVSGLSTTANWIGAGTSMQAYYGHSVSTAGDVNGDGYSDIIIGGIYQDTVRVYHGSNIGLSTTANWYAVTGDISYQFGYSVSDAGDVNGDGYGDVVATAPNYDNGMYDEGIALVYYGNSGGVDIRPRQWRPDFSVPVEPSLHTYSSDQVGLSLFGRTFYGRSDIKVQFEVKPLGVPFNGMDLVESNWTDVGLTGIDIQEVIPNLSNNYLYKWRARIKYPLTHNPQSSGPWFHVPENGMTECDFRIGPPVSVQEVPSDLVQRRGFMLHQGYPNPFNRSLTIDFDIMTPGEAALSIYDITGTKITTLYSQKVQPRTYSITWDGTDGYGNCVANGIYFVTLRFDKSIEQTVKVTYIK